MIWENKKQDIGEWHDTFLLLPERLVDGRTAWLRTVEQRMVAACLSATVWEYREKAATQEP